MFTETSVTNSFILDLVIGIVIFIAIWKGLMKIRKKRMEEYKEMFGKKDKKEC